MRGEDEGGEPSKKQKTASDEAKAPQQAKAVKTKAQPKTRPKGSEDAQIYATPKKNLDKDFEAASTPRQDRII